MSKILRRPMFRGGKLIDSRGTGITSGLMDGGRVGYQPGGKVTTGGDLNPGIFGFKFDHPFLSMKTLVGLNLLLSILSKYKNQSM